MPPFHPRALLVPSLIAAARADCGMLAQVGSCATGGGGRGGGRYAGEAGGALVARVLRPARAEVASYHRLHHPSVPLGLLLQAWWRCVCAHRLVRRRWFCSKPPSPSLTHTLPLAVPLRPPAEPEASEEEYLPTLEAAATVCIPVSVAVSLSDGQPQKHNLRSGTRVQGTRVHTDLSILVGLTNVG